MYKLYVSDREYNEITVVFSKDLKPTDITIDAIGNKMFTQDIFDIINGKVIVQHSTVKNSCSIPAVLVLEGNKMFGRYKDKFLYKCVPDDKRLPIFLVPYKIKPGFNKKVINKYVTFEFRNWDSKHPMGVITQTIGDVNILPNFYEYQLYCKSLYASIQDFTKKTMRKLKTKSENEFIDEIIRDYKLVDRRNDKVYSIDPSLSKDFDDAFSFKYIDDNICSLSIFISNVAIWLDALDLWSSFSNRIATIYLPDRKRPMLPTVLSDALCSLQEERTRFAFTLQIDFDIENMKIIKYNFTNSVIRVTKNLRYDTEEQETNLMYLKLKAFIFKLNKIKDFRYMESIDTSHEVVAYLMILMNYISAKEMKSKKVGIYRSAKYNDISKYNPPEEATTKVKKFLKMWQSSGGTYVKYDNIEGHEILDLDAYVHITSPIRRLVDLLNILQFQDALNLVKLSENSSSFYDRWTSDESFEYINLTMRSIRKVQNDCSLLKLCVDNKEIMNIEHNGFIFDKLVRNDGLFQYMVYLEDLNMVNRIASRFEYDNYSLHKCKLFIFGDEVRLKQKIRIEVCN
jgi:exoribonuclease R